MMKFEIRLPDIGSLVNAAKKYSHLVDKNNGDFDELWKFMNEQMALILKQAHRLEIKLFASDQELKRYIEDNERKFFLTLGTAWALGWEFAETNPTQAQYCMISQDTDSSFMLPSTKNELADLADSAMFLILISLRKTYQVGAIDDKTLALELEEIRKTFHDCIFWAFKYGIVKFFKEKNKT